MIPVRDVNSQIGMSSCYTLVLGRKDGQKSVCECQADDGEGTMAGVQISGQGWAGRDY